MNKEEKLISIVNSYSRKIFPETNPDKALFEYERFCTELIEENKRLKDNWNKLKEYINQREEESDNIDTLIEFNIAFNQVRLKMQELENGDSNE